MDARLWFWDHDNSFVIVGETYYSYCRDLMYQAAWDGNESLYYFYERCPE